MFFAVYKGHEIFERDGQFHVKDNRSLKGSFSNVRDAKIYIESEISNRMKKALLVEIPFSGFYQTCHGEMFETWIEYEEQRLIDEHNATDEQIEELRRLFYTNVNWEACRKDYAEAYCEAFCDEINRVLGGRKFWMYSVAVDSPKEYNFVNDRILAKIDVEIMSSIVDGLISPYWYDFVMCRCQSVDGFASLIPANFNEWDKDFTKWNASQLGLVLEFFALRTLYEVDFMPYKMFNSDEILMDYDSGGKLSESIWNNSGEKLKAFLNSFYEV